MAPRELPLACDYCGLPAGSSIANVDEPVFCCFGCRFAASITAAQGDDGQSRWMMTRLGLAVFFTMNVMVFTMLLWSQPDGEPSAQAGALYGLARHACLLFTAPVLVLLGGPLCDDAIAELRRGRASLNLLLLVGVAAAFAMSAWATWRNEGHVYFEVACMVLVAVTLGRWLEASGKLRTTEALRELRQLLPDRVRRRGADSGEQEVALATVQAGDVLRLLPGEHVPTDGRIVAGQASLDERSVTGESVPAAKGPGDVVHSGTCNLDGELLVEVTAPPGAGTLERLIDAVAAAAATSRQQRLAERIAAWFLPLVLVTAVVTCAVHWRTGGAAAGILAGLAVVVVSCPCALGLATPMALWAAIGQATRRHVLVRDGDAFTKLAIANVYCFDKTGTITTGCRVNDVESFGGIEPDRVLAVAADLARGSTHIQARAIEVYATEAGVTAADIDSPRTIPGCGIEGELCDAHAAARLGSSRWVRGAFRSADPPTLLAIGTEIVGGFRFAEDVRPEAAAAVGTLRRRGADTWMLSGDRADRAAAVAEPLDLRWRAPLLPAEKLAAIEGFRAAGRRVVMVGDGINDAPALAAADVGVALGCGADVSRWSADICLLRDDLAALPWLVDLASRTRRTIRWNLLWAFGYNAACIPLAATGIVHPAVAAVAMVASSLLVVSNSLRLGRDEPSATAGGANQTTPVSPDPIEVAA
ncbi:MAG: cation-translocating P-type ATPase [Pirellulales bacterium]